MKNSPLKISIGELEKDGAIIGIQDGNHGEKHPKASDYVDEGIPFIMANNVLDGRVDVKGCSFITKAQANSLRIGFSHSGDVLLTHKGTVGNVAVVPQLADYIMLTPQVTYYRVNPKKLDNRYLSYAFREPDFQSHLAQFSAQSTRPYIGITAQRGLSILYWPFSTQKKIAAVLSAYDDLIANNERRIKIQEEMAQNLYREWFVNFKFPGHEKVKMVDSPLGKIPQGWEVKKLGDVADINKRSIKRGKEPDNIVYVDIASVGTGIIHQKQAISFASAPGRARRFTQHGDIIWSCVRPNRRSYSLILNPEPNLIVSTGFVVISGTKAPFTYLYHVLTTDDFVGYLINHARGSAYPAVSSEDFVNASILLPHDLIIRKFHEVTCPMFELKHQLTQRNTNLRQTRDLLLPKLISGEVDVSDLDIAVPGTAA